MVGARLSDADSLVATTSRLSLSLSLFAARSGICETSGMDALLGGIGLACLNVVNLHLAFGALGLQKRQERGEARQMQMQMQMQVQVQHAPTGSKVTLMPADAALGARSRVCSLERHAPPVCRSLSRRAPHTLAEYVRSNIHTRAGTAKDAEEPPAAAASRPASFVALLEAVAGSSQLLHRRWLVPTRLSFGCALGSNRCRLLADGRKRKTTVASRRCG